jgi:hypothetical protein
MLAMRWTRLGRVFDPREFELPDNCSEFAQAPQVLLLGDVVRTYFSTRYRDDSGKYLSHVAFVDFDRHFDVLRVSTGTVVGLGKLGCYDEHGVFPFNVLRTEHSLFGYIGGWSRRVSVSVDGSIGLAVSEDDGLTFRRLGDGPVLTASPREPFLIGDPFVRVFDGRFHMWYIFGTAWKRFSGTRVPDRVYKIGHAVSRDGVEWEKREEGRRVVADVLGADESQALPTVIKIGSKYHMLFCFRHSFEFRERRDRGYRIGHAVSEDLHTWTRVDGDFARDVGVSAWDSDMQCYPHVFEMDGAVYLMYNGNEFGRFGFGVARLEEWAL